MMIVDTYLVRPFPGVCGILTNPRIVYCIFTYEHGDVNKYPTDMTELCLFIVQVLNQKRILMEIFDAYLLLFIF